MLKLMFHPKQLMVISAGGDADIRVWDLITKSCAATLKVLPMTPLRHCPQLLCCLCSAITYCGHCHSAEGRICQFAGSTVHVCHPPL